MASTCWEGRLEETHSTSETRSQGQRKGTLASRSLANAELGVLAGVPGVVREGSGTRHGLDWARLIGASEVKKGRVDGAKGREVPSAFLMEDGVQKGGAAWRWRTEVGSPERGFSVKVLLPVP